MQTQEKRKISYSAMQPSGSPTLGNYIGALKNWVKLQEDYDCIYCAANLHALTVRPEPAQLRRRTYDTIALMIACGVDPEKSILYIQSQVPAHSELAWLLNCSTYMGELSRMTQFKDKSRKHADNINVGLLDYPVLMAADILLYQTDIVPIGADQKQHLELARDLAIRFNNAYSPTFKVPEGFIPQVGARIMSLQDPTSKMSKSDAENSFIAVLDPPDVIRRKYRSCVTDSLGSVNYDPENQPGVSNLLSIYSTLTGCTVYEAADTFAGQGYAQLKNGVADATIAELEPIQNRFKEITADKAYLEEITAKNAVRAARIAGRTLDKVQRKLGVIAPPRM